MKKVKGYLKEHRDEIVGTALLCTACGMGIYFGYKIGNKKQLKELKHIEDHYDGIIRNALKHSVVIKNTITGETVRLMAEYV